MLTLYCRVLGSIISRGLPFTLMRPFPLLQWATAVAVFWKSKCVLAQHFHFYISSVKHISIYLEQPKNLKYMSEICISH